MRFSQQLSLSLTLSHKWARGLLNFVANQDKSLLMEKLGAIESADSFGSATVLRNKFAHVYPEESKEQFEKLNLLPVKSEFVVDAFNHLVFYAVKKGLIEEDIFSRLFCK